MGFAVREYWERSIAFLRDAKAELKKVTFMDKKTTAKAALAVVVISAFFAVYLGLVDLGFSKLIKHLLRS